MEQSATCSNKPRNRLLAALPNNIYQRICVFLEPVELPQHQVLYHPGDRYQYAYFPTDAIVSNVAILENGSTAEIGVIGNEGMVGVPIILNTDYVINSSLVVQVSGSGLRIPASELVKEFKRTEVFQRLLLHYVQARIIQISQTATCNSYHTIEQRLARWMLTVRDSVQQDEFYLTQEFISQMLGVRRA